LKFEYLFYLTDRLFYFINNEYYKRLVVFLPLVQEFLQNIYNDKYHFGRECILKDLNNIYIRNKTREIDKYLKIYHLYSMNRIDNQLLVGSLQLILALFQPIYTIFLDFVVEFPTVFSKDILWAIEGFDAFDSFLTIICKVSKRKLLIPDNKRYLVKDWGCVLGRQLLLNNWSCPKAIISDCDSKFTSVF
jgi:hypothetical protein